MPIDILANIRYNETIKRKDGNSLKVKDMVDIRIIWKNEIQFLSDVADDCIKNEFSDDVLDHAAEFVGVFDSGLYDVKFLYGQTFCHCEIEQTSDGKLKFVGMRWLNCGYDKREWFESKEDLIKKIESLTKEEAYERFVKNSDNPVFLLGLYEKLEGEESKHAGKYVKFGTES